MLQSKHDGVVLCIRVFPGTRSKVERCSDGVIRVGVREPPERGRATSAALRALAVALGVPIGAVFLVQGATSRNKRVRVSVAANILKERIEQLPMAAE